MFRQWLLVAAACTAVTACGGSPTGPSGGSDGGRVARLTHTRFLAFGDSITAGEVTAPVGFGGEFGKLVLVPAASYPSVLQGQLQSSYAAQAGLIAVNNQGRAGETIFDGVLRFEQVFAGSGAEVVLLQEGVNGLGIAGPDASTSLMRSMVQRAKNGGARVFVGSMLPTIEGRQRSQIPAQLIAYNDALRAMCTAEGVTYVDLYNGLLAEVQQVIGSDGLHPNEAGYRRIAEIFMAAIRTELEER